MGGATLPGASNEACCERPGCWAFCVQNTRPKLGPPAVPFCPLWGEGSPAKIDYRKKGTLILTSLLWFTGDCTPVWNETMRSSRGVLWFFFAGWGDYVETKSCIRGWPITAFKPTLKRHL